MERFDKLSKINQSAFATMVIDRCNMNCGDFIELVCAWETLQSNNT